MTTRLLPGSVIVGLAIAFATIVAVALRVAWNPPFGTYADFVPIAAVFAALISDRWFAPGPASARRTLCDMAVVALALCRVIVPPFPFVSGHALLTMYTAATAQAASVRAIAVIVLVHVIYTKVFVQPGWLSLLGGLAVAIAIAAVTRRDRAAEATPPELIR